MAYPNPDVYGQPESWDYSFINGGLTTDTAKVLKIQKAKVPKWAYEPDNAGYWNSQLRLGITEGKLTQNVPIDKTVCAVGMGNDCPFATMGYFRRVVREGAAGDVGLDSVVRVGNGVVNGFLWEMRCQSYGNYSLLSAGGGQIDEKQMTYRTWAPSSDNVLNSSNQNGNYFIAPYTYYQLKTFISSIQVYVCNSADIPDDPAEITQVPTATWRSLDSWKNDYPDHKIIGLRVVFARANQILDSGGRVKYTRPSNPSAYTYSVPCGFGILDELSFDEELQYKVYDYALFADGAGWSTVIFKPFTDTVWNNSVHRIAFFGMYNVFSTYLRYLSGAVWYQIPYSDEIYDSICRAVATFGFIFVTDGTLTLPSAMNTENICFPVVANNGVIDGDYTRGAANEQNSLYNLDSIFDWQPTQHDIVHDNPDGTEYFNQHSNAYDSALSNLNNNYRMRLEILTDEETVIGEITKDLSLTAAGQITINYEQITRRSCSLSLINVDNKYIPTKNSPFWLNRKFKLWLGLVVGKDTYWWSQGIFYTVSANATGRILSIEGVDKGGALDGTLKLNMTEAQYQFKRGTALTEMIKQTLALDVGNPYGANNSPIGFGDNRPIDSQPPLIGVEYYGFNTVADISIDANSYISEMFVNMAELYAADCYYNTNGNLVFEQHIDSSGYNYVPTQWSFTDLSSTFEDVNYEYSYEGENVVTVYTNTTEAGVRNVAWTAYNTNPLSPLNVATGIRRAPHIEIPYYHNEQLSQDQQEAQQIKDCRSTANHYLLANSMLGMTLNFNAPIIPHMDVNKTIQISDQYADIEDGIYVVQSLTIPLSSDKMQISATNINWLPNDMTFSGVSEIVESNNTQNGGAET